MLINRNIIKNMIKNIKLKKKIYEENILKDLKLFYKYNYFLNDLTIFIFLFFKEIN